MFWCVKFWFCFSLVFFRSKFWVKDFGENSLLEVVKNIVIGKLINIGMIGKLINIGMLN